LPTPEGILGLGRDVQVSAFRLRLSPALLGALTCTLNQDR
jgi:hypothetical protein